MRTVIAIVVIAGVGLGAAVVMRGRTNALKLAPGWQIELVAEAPRILFPTAIVAAPDGTIYVGQDPMDMPGPPTSPIDSIVALKDGKVTVFAEKLWSVMGLEWVGDTLFVVHAPYLSALRDTDGDGKADQRVDLVTGLGPKVPGFNGINDHVASGIRLAMDGFLYISIGDKGIPHGVGKDGTIIQLHGGGVIRVRPDGSNLEVVSTGERNPMSVALTTTDEIFTYGNDDDCKKWPNSLTHHIVGGHYGYPYEFLASPSRCLPIVDGRVGGAGAQGICYNEDGLADKFRGNLFFCDWGLGAVTRYELDRSGGTFRVKEKEYIVRKGTLGDFRPFSLTVGDHGQSLYLVDWAFRGFLVDGPKTGRLFRLTYQGRDRVKPASRPKLDSLAARLAALDHPAHSVRLEAQRGLVASRSESEDSLIAVLKGSGHRLGRIHALWALDAIGTEKARKAIHESLADSDVSVQTEAARSSGIHRDREAVAGLVRMLGAPTATARREAAIALGRIGDPKAVSPLMTALGDNDPFVDWSIRAALRSIDACDVAALSAALEDPARRTSALALCDEWWSIPVARSLANRPRTSSEPAWRARLVATLAGLYRRYPEWSGSWFGPNPLVGEFPRKTRDWDPAAMTTVFDGLASALDDSDPTVRQAAIGGLLAVGKRALSRLRVMLTRETDATNLATLARAMGDRDDRESVPALVGLVNDVSRTIDVRAAALGSLEVMKQTHAVVGLVRDKDSPTELVARALPGLSRDGHLAVRDLLPFLRHPTTTIRAAAVRALAVHDRHRPEVRHAALAALEDPAESVRHAAIEAAFSLGIAESVPRLMQLAQEEAFRTEAIEALAKMPDARAYPVFLDALGDRSPSVRSAAESALMMLGDQVRADLESRARAGGFTGPTAVAVERILNRFTPLTDWKVLGPFPRNTPPLFTNTTPIDFSRAFGGAEGRTITWSNRSGDPPTGRVTLGDLKAGAGDRGGFGYDLTGSPDLAAFAYTEVDSDRDRTALALIGSSGTITVSVNSQKICQFDHPAGRPFNPNSDSIRIALKKGTNSILVRTRQGIGTWSFSIRISDPSAPLISPQPNRTSSASLREYAMSHPGDPVRGEAIFFDPKGIGCVKCHSAVGKGTAHVGPDLTGLSLKYDKAEIIRSILEPSNRIATGYQPVLIATNVGTVISGLLRSETETHLDLIDADAKPIRIVKSEIDARRVGDTSLMPATLVDSLSPREFADLIAYLESLREMHSLTTESTESTEKIEDEIHSK